MKTRPIFLVAAALAAVAVGGVVHSAPKAGEAVTVRVLRAKVMKNPRFIGPTSATVSRGQQLTFREARGAWYRIEGRADGWIHKSNVVDGKVQLSSRPGGGGGGASREEVELAGRGFTPQVEDKYREGNPELDFSHVDGIERTEIDPDGLESFVREGGLSGGAR